MFFKNHDFLPTQKSSLNPRPKTYRSPSPPLFTKFLPFVFFFEIKSRHGPSCLPGRHVHPELRCQVTTQRLHAEPGVRAGCGTVRLRVGKNGVREAVVRESASICFFLVFFFSSARSRKRNSAIARAAAAANADVEARRRPKTLRASLCATGAGKVAPRRRSRDSTVFDGEGMRRRKLSLFSPQPPLSQRSVTF